MRATVHLRKTTVSTEAIATLLDASGPTTSRLVKRRHGARTEAEKCCLHNGPDERVHAEAEQRVGVGCNVAAITPTAANRPARCNLGNRSATTPASSEMSDVQNTSSMGIDHRYGDRPG